jgi:hypothetical protein
MRKKLIPLDGEFVLLLHIKLHTSQANGKTMKENQIIVLTVKMSWRTVRMYEAEVESPTLNFAKDAKFRMGHPPVGRPKKFGRAKR